MISSLLFNLLIITFKNNIHIFVRFSQVIIQYIWKLIIYFIINFQNMIGSWTAKKLNETPDLPVKPNIEADVDIQAVKNLKK